MKIIQGDLIFFANFDEFFYNLILIIFEAGEIIGANTQ